MNLILKYYFWNFSNLNNFKSIFGLILDLILSHTSNTRELLTNLILMFSIFIFSIFVFLTLSVKHYLISDMNIFYLKILIMIYIFYKFFSFFHILSHSKYFLNINFFAKFYNILSHLRILLFIYSKNIYIFFCYLLY